MSEHRPILPALNPEIPRLRNVIIEVVVLPFWVSVSIDFFENLGRRPDFYGFGLEALDFVCGLIHNSPIIPNRKPRLQINLKLFLVSV